jgi:hypothetical protein
LRAQSHRPQPGDATILRKYSEQKLLGMHPKIHLPFIFAPDRVQSVKSRSESALSRATQLFSTLFFTELLKTGKEKWN